jgi:hypothetical protein
MDSLNNFLYMILLRLVDIETLLLDGNHETLQLDENI